ncbi:MAG: dTMP kinase [Acidimicrobiia bacterium]|nr:dTMP kinase [Acidimicrobiia bacterium]
MTGRGRFIVLEGLDGVGKSTQARRLAEGLGARLTREPGGTPLGERIRALVLDHGVGDVAPRTEALLMAAARAQHVAEAVGPALASGCDVVTDRYLYSSVAYQGYGRQLDPDAIRALSLWAVDGLEPDLVLLLEGPARLGHRIADRLEAEDAAFHARVAAGYEAQLLADPARWARVDAGGSEEATAAAVLAAVELRWAR